MWNLVSQCEIGLGTQPVNASCTATQPKLTKNSISRKNTKERSVNEVVKLERHDVIGIVTVNSPPVNALSAAVRGGILECIKAAIADTEIKGIVLTCAGRTFIAGADITEFGKPPKPPGL